MNRSSRRKNVKEKTRKNLGVFVFRLMSVLFVLIVVLFQFSCSAIQSKPYGEVSKDFLEDYLNQDFSGALSKANEFVNFSQNQQKQDYHLSLLERGKVALAGGDYVTAIRDLQKAEKFFLDIEGRISISEESGALFTNETGKQYQAEPYEILQINPYLALAYFLNGDFQGARVERNRSMNKIHYYIEQSGKTYLENPFSRYLSALIYEWENKIRDAEIEYDKMLKFAKDINFIQAEKEHLKGKRTDTELVLFLESGLSPSKHEKKYGPIPVPVGKYLVTVAFAYAELQNSSYYGDSYEVFLNSESKGWTHCLYDLEATVVEQYRKTQDKRIGNLVKRVAVKQGGSLVLQVLGQEVIEGEAGMVVDILGKLFGVATAFMEKADLRSWRTLPKSFQVKRIRGLLPGEYVLRLKGKNGAIRERSITIQEGKKELSYLVFPR